MSENSGLVDIGSGSDSRVGGLRTHNGTQTVVIVTGSVFRSLFRPVSLWKCSGVFVYGGGDDTLSLHSFDSWGIDELKRLG